MGNEAILHFFCGKMAAGKSTRAKRLAEEVGGVLLVEDELLSQLYPEEIVDLATYVKYSQRLKGAIANHIRALLAAGMPVVLDFPGNTLNQRKWFKELFESVGVPHRLHYLEVSDEVCKRQLRERSKGKVEGAAFTSDVEFDAITKYFQPPTDEEGFHIVRYEARS
ncbi:AAA family ATPase [Stenomitos frigidus]|uniref:Cell division protein ZipA n=1 Tax=Stenomitos frigidus ULC18 TaxID=2107698 RepID=A0A2T1E7E3_9CYAN|nr:ATP-binding protein [Stenomitos frigidus]PSB28659.1 cell division protein ZipA [Stenomitos frigidus ULC18]